MYIIYIMIKYKIIVAQSKNFGIGYENKLPWRLPSDLKRFMTLTLSGGNNAIVMGKNTWESLPKKPLKKRDNLILSSTLKIDENSANNIAKSFESIIDIHQFCLKKKYDSVWIIGGETVYNNYLELGIISEIYLTYIDKDFICDRFFNNIPLGFDIVSKESTTENNLKVEYIKYILKTTYEYESWYYTFSKKYKGNFDEIVKAENNIIDQKQKKGYYFTRENENVYIRDFTLDVSTIIKPFIRQICQSILKIKPIIRFNIEIQYDKNKMTMLYLTKFPIPLTIIFTVNKITEEDILAMIDVRLNITPHYLTDNFNILFKTISRYALYEFMDIYSKS